MHASNQNLQLRKPYWVPSIFSEYARYRVYERYMPVCRLREIIMLVIFPSNGSDIITLSNL